MRECLENDLCGCCYKKTCVLISDSSLYEFEICKTCYLKLRVQSEGLSVEGSVLRARGRHHRGMKRFPFNQRIFASSRPGHLRRV